MRHALLVVLLVLAGCGTTAVLTEHWKVTRERIPTANGGYMESEVGERGAETKTRIVVAAPKALNLILGFLTPGGLGGIATVLTAGAGIVAALRGLKYRAATKNAAEYADSLEDVIDSGEDKTAKELARKAKENVAKLNKPIQTFVQKARGKA
jgi:hypothetical protein